MKKTAPGFALAELLVVLAIVAIFVAAIMVVVNPFEVVKRSKDTTRIADLNSLQQAISTALYNSTDAVATLCYNLSAPCTDVSTNSGSKSNNGTGWIKVNFAGQLTLTVSTLPVDPINNSVYHYTYYSDGEKFELNAVLESNQYKATMSKDGGDNANVFEVGSNLTLLN